MYRTAAGQPNPALLGSFSEAVSQKLLLHPREPPPPGSPQEKGQMFPFLLVKAVGPAMGLLKFLLDILPAEASADLCSADLSNPTEGFRILPWKPLQVPPPARPNHHSPMSQWGLPLDSAVEGLLTWPQCGWCILSRGCKCTLHHVYDIQLIVCMYHQHYGPKDGALRLQCKAPKHKEGLKR